MSDKLQLVDDCYRGPDCGNVDKLKLIGHSWACVTTEFEV